jgi:hypothetical protein
MAPLEQQWVKVQQKTFTKWLNSKIKARDVQISDLVSDLSDGVCTLPEPLPSSPRYNNMRLSTNH